MLLRKERHLPLLAHHRKTKAEVIYFTKLGGHEALGGVLVAFREEEALHRGDLDQQLLAEEVAILEDLLAMMVQVEMISVSFGTKEWMMDF